LKIAFRTDASLLIGTGHVMRCLTLADALRARGADCVFLCRPHTGHLLTQIGDRGHRVVALPAPPSTFTRSPADPPHGDWLGTDWRRDAEEARDALSGQGVDWLVVDHYALDRRWEAALRPACRRLMAMDDLADRPHDCDLLLDPSLGRESADYAELLPVGAVTLLGPQFALLRPEFAQHRTESLARRAAPALRHLLITMGGVDKDNATGRVLEALDGCTLPPGLRITAVMGPHSPWLAEVQARAARMRVPTQVQVGVMDMARLMTDSDLAIGAAGGTSWERCCLGVPGIVLILAENQHGMAMTLQAAGAIVATTSAEEAARWLQAQVSAGTISDFLARLSVAAACVTDGRGVIRVEQIMLQRDD